jgi:hypothetical protein
MLRDTITATVTGGTKSNVDMFAKLPKKRQTSRTTGTTMTVQQVLLQHRLSRTSSE